MVQYGSEHVNNELILKNCYYCCCPLSIIVKNCLIIFSFVLYDKGAGWLSKLSRETEWALSKMNRILRYILPHWSPKSLYFIVSFPNIIDLTFLILEGKGWWWVSLLQYSRNARQKDSSKAPRFWNMLALTLWALPERAILKWQNQLDIACS